VNLSRVICVVDRDQYPALYDVLPTEDEHILYDLYIHGIVFSVCECYSDLH
jgi:hypothetical protein